jgi:eukaryotic-like serine/threonine-protein kinase
MESLVGKKLGHYQLVAKLGSKGAIELYKAYQPDLKLDVAIKILVRSPNADQLLINRFEREASTNSKLNHRNIVRVLDFGMDQEIYYMVMQFINGPTLKEEIKARRRQGTRFSLAEIGRIYLSLGEVIDYVHTQGIIHRNLKPGNVMINEAGQVLLTGFGIALILGETQNTSPGVVMGTPAYMSPEQARGGLGDERSDLYALGIMLCELVTGRLPYKGDTPTATLLKHLAEPVPMVRQVNPNVPEAVESVIAKALSKKPEARYQSAEELSLALQMAVGLEEGDTLWQHPLKPVALRQNDER